MKCYALRTSDNNVVFMQFLEDTDIDSEVSKWEESSPGVTIESILELQGLPDNREELEELRNSLKEEIVNG